MSESQKQFATYGEQEKFKAWWNAQCVQDTKLEWAAWNGWLARSSVPSERGEFEVLRVERDKARAMYERAISHLTRIHAFLNPPVVEVGGKTYRFNNPDANETLQALSDAIRAIPEDLRSAPSAIRESVTIPRSLAERSHAMFQSVDPSGGIASEWRDALDLPRYP